MITKYVSLALLLTGAVLAIALQQTSLGLIFITLALIPTKNKRFNYHIATIAAALVILTFTPVNTSIAQEHFFIMGMMCTLALTLPYFLLIKEPINVKLVSKKQWQPLPIFYLVFAFAAAYFILPWLFHTYPQIAHQWPQPQTTNDITLFFIGTNALGIWDELFFINTIFAILLRFYPLWIANLAQGILFTSFLYELGFIAIAPLFIFPFTLLQGLAYKKTESLSYVIILHLIIDAVLFITIMNYYYPGYFALFN